MAISFTPLGSGSKGNSILVCNEKHKFLIDCGFSFKGLKERLRFADTKIEEIEAVIITHEHGDHIKSAKILSELCGIKIYGTPKTLEATRSAVGHFSGSDILNYEAFPIGNIEVQPFRIPHDAADPVGYAISDYNSRALYATDLGYVTVDMLLLAEESELIMIESNYDADMLKNGPYPSFLKARISSKYGHLSNDYCARAVLTMAKKGTKKFILGHLSECNNTPSKASEKLTEVMTKAGAVSGVDYLASVATQKAISARVCAKDI